MTLARLVRPSSGFILSKRATSDVARALQTLATDLKESRVRAVTLGPLTTLSELATAAAGARTPDWDGYGARAVEPETVAAAKAFIDQLPAFVPAPSVTPEPDGELSLEWRPGPWSAFSVSIGAQGRLTYAGVYGRTSNIRGTELLGDFIPEAILNGLTRTFQS